MNEYLICGIALYILSYLFYIKISRGLGHKAEYLQLRRFFPCAVLAVLPCYLAQLPLTSPQFLISLFVGVMWIITYPLFYSITYHKNSTDFGFHLDTVFGLYIIGWLTGLKILVQYFNFMPTVSMVVISVAEFSVLLNRHDVDMVGGRIVDHQSRYANGGRSGKQGFSKRGTDAIPR